ncbi:MAG TPA: BCD family MFS transporter [Pseudomonadales bacterium]|nr:BCD family MFS transporter [Pseudomonadales bacterium]
MSSATSRSWSDFWVQLGPKWLPFADVATAELPLGRLARLSLFQVSVGMALVLLNGTLNRVMIVELGMSASLVALMVALPLVFAPLRALVGHRSDNYISALGWRRVPFIFFGTGLQFGGLAIMPFALLIMSGDAVNGPVWIGHVFAALAFLLVGAGLHTTQTAGLALANDLAPEGARPRVVAFLYVTLLLGMIVAALVFGALLAEFSNLRLIKIIQGAAVVSLLLNFVALWKQEARNPAATSAARERPPFAEAWKSFLAGGRVSRLLVAVGLGTAAFGMQDILLEPYGGQVLGLSVSATTVLTALLAGGTLAAFALAARRLGRGEDPHRLAAIGALVGVAAFSAVIFAGPLESTLLFRVGTVLIGFGGGLFSVGTLVAAMALGSEGLSGLALGAWGAVQATALGASIAIGGALRDFVSELAVRGALGPALTQPEVGYSVVYHLEIALLFATLIAIGPLVRHALTPYEKTEASFGLAEFPG